MKKVAKVASLLMCLALFISIIPFNAAAAKLPGYEEFKLVEGDVVGGVYKQGLSGPFDDTHYEAEIPELLDICMIDNDLEISWWSKPIKFVDLHDEDGTWVPAILINLTRDGKPAENVGGFTYWIRDLFDCLPTHFAIQVATDSAKSQWKTVYEEEEAEWDDYPEIYYFDPVDAYAIRFVAFNIDEPNYLGEAGEYDNLEGDDTRLCCSELEVLIYTGTGNPPANPTEKPTEPTEKPTEPKPTDPKATEPEATDPEATDPEATDPETTDPEASDPETTDPEASDPEASDPEASDPEATDPEATEPEATEPEATESVNNETQAPTKAPATNEGGKEEPKSNAGLIIGIVAAVLVVAGGAVLIIKKKK